MSSENLDVSSELKSDSSFADRTKSVSIAEKTSVIAVEATSTGVEGRSHAAETSTDPLAQPNDELNKCVVVVNKESGTVCDLWDDHFEAELLERLKANGWEPGLKLVKGEEIEETVVAAKSRKIGGLIAGGGDGTTNSIARLMLGSDIPMGILPFGTLNLAARDLGSPLEPLDAVASLYPGRTREIDALELGDRLCLCMAILGVYPELLNKSEEFHGRNWWRKFTKLGSDFFKAFLSSPKMELSLGMDGTKAERVKSRMLIVVPGHFQDDFGIIPKRESLEGGKCTLLVSKHSSAWSLFRMIGNFLLGRSAQDPDLEVKSAATLSINALRRKKVLLAIDGELAKFKVPLKLDLKKRALLVLDPKASEE
ncbi:diacylglycerol/lipid kinase family protein [Pelagicoccus albus]|uniref:DAGKc domain-containing protein n=1 Tax=Pelagicoccus albus TaxID=415222 RepID=A0A7X1B9K1_9BACT|nr:diacylglycerol kinase family protein [Pelagicoccus albus]MBC2608057.1 hypothetical protein [Pelagicoccus albus]